MSNISNIITLPSGKKVKLKNVPQDMTQDRLKEILIREGRATSEDFIPAGVEMGLPTGPGQRGAGARGQGATAADIGRFFEENLDIPGGIAGAVTGAKLGAAGGLPGILLGGILGGAAGTFTGAIGSDLLTEEEIDWMDATYKALESAAFDVGTLGLAKGARSAWLLSKMKMGHTPQEAAELIIKRAEEGAPTGSPESLRASQRILMERGATFSRSQTGQASALENFMERLGGSGLLSTAREQKKLQDINNAIRLSLSDVVNRQALRGDASPREVGETMYSIVEAGRSALTLSYGDGLDEIIGMVNNKMVNTAPIRKNFQRFLESKKVRSYGPEEGDVAVKSELQDDVKNFLESELNNVLSQPKMDAASFLRYDKTLTNKIKDLRSGEKPNTEAARQLSEAVDLLKNDILRVVAQADPQAAKKYAELKKDYKESIQSLMPEITGSTIRAAQKEDYDTLGKMLLQQTNVSKVKAFMGSIDEAYKQLGRRANLPSEVPYTNAKEAKEAIKVGYLRGLFPKVDAPDFDYTEYAQMAARFSKPANDDMLKAVAGKDYKRVKQIMSLMAEAAQKADGNVGTLFLRGKEYSSARSLASQLTLQGGPVATAGAAGGLVGGPVGAAFSMAAVLLSPVFLTNLAFNQKAVNRLIAFEGKKFASEEAKEKALSLLIDDVVRGMNEYQQAEFRAEMENL